MDIDHTYVADNLENGIQDDDGDSEFASDDEDALEEFPDMISHAGHEYGRGMARKAYAIMASTTKYVRFPVFS